MAIEINLATYDKQNEILRKLNEGGEGYFYLLASADSTAMPTDIEALKGLKNIKSIVNSEAAMRAVLNSSTAMEAVANSSTAMNALLNSKNTKTLTGKKIISGKFLPLRAMGNFTDQYQAYNGKWSNIGSVLGGWLKANSSNPVATKIKLLGDYEIYYYDLNA